MLSYVRLKHFVHYTIYDIILCPHILFVKQQQQLPIRPNAVRTITRAIRRNLPSSMYNDIIGTAVRSVMVYFQKDNNSKSRTRNNDYHCCCARKCYMVCVGIPPMRETIHL